MPFNIQGPELILILIIALIVIGPGKLPEVGSALGKSIREFRKAATDVKESTRLDAAAAPASAPTAAQAPAPTAPTADSAAAAAPSAAQPPVGDAPAAEPVAVGAPASGAAPETTDPTDRQA